jgi:hypothetical protein
MIRLFAADAGDAPIPLIDIADADWEILLDVLDVDDPTSFRADGFPEGYLIDSETVSFLEWNGMNPAVVSALKGELGPDGFVEVSWEELGVDV